MDDEKYYDPWYEQGEIKEQPEKKLDCYLGYNKCIADCLLHCLCDNGKTANS